MTEKWHQLFPAATKDRLETIGKYRQMAKTDLFFLTKEVLGKQKLNERVHKPVCDLFVKKDDTKLLDQQDTITDRLLLDPRGHFKTTIDIADAIQWNLNFPGIRELFMSGTEKLVLRMLGEVQHAFQRNSRMRELFPEFCYADKVKQPSESFTSPARAFYDCPYFREPTIDISTFTSAQASIHIDVAKLDDVVNENTITEDALEKGIEAVGYVRDLLDPPGYLDRIGTRYDFGDMYGWTLDQIEDYTQETIDFGIKLSTPTFKGLIRKCWQCNHDPNIDCAQAGEEAHVLMFPERFTFQKFIEKRKLYPYIFNCQQLNDPRPTEKAQFTEELILSHTIPREHVPRQGGRTFQMWDLNGAGNSQQACYCAVATGFYDGNGRCFITDFDMGRWNPYELVQKIVWYYMLWRPGRLGIEAATGVPLIAPALEVTASRYGLILPLDWVKVNTTKNAKELRIGALQALMNRNMLYFSDLIRQRHPEAWPELIKQFTRFPRYKFKDGPDAIAMLVENYRDVVDVSNCSWKEPEMISAPAYEGCEVLGTGLIG